MRQETKEKIVVFIIAAVWIFFLFGILGYIPIHTKSEMIIKEQEQRQEIPNEQGVNNR